MTWVPPNARVTVDLSDWEKLVETVGRQEDEIEKLEVAAEYAEKEAAIAQQALEEHGLRPEQWRNS